ncbi:juvenile hormone esterase-like [Neodiprion fabricii]|uniref:juvenile hormone esterase-like n=1 Tax=Neodiprion fabricii TaxID=2872261 RepID=UPI001ED96BA2|nr:juvenile hormone esterase-like [Neodiprion fabricii]
MDRIARVFLCLVIITTFKASAREDPRLCIKDGCLIGLTEISRLGREYYSFLGIPFAKPPVDNLRFKPPEKPEPWDTLEAKRDGKICPQSIIYRRPNDPESSEDCLYLNVYSPKIPAGESKTGEALPVMVIFHSGGFQYWSGTRDHFPGNYLLDHDVVVVSANYRLNVFGFLSTEDEVSPGNYGLKDQRRVLEWIQENIAAFGGDPMTVTIQGQDAGAASVHFHMMSSSSRGLFHRAIAQSGSAMAPWALSLPGEAREHANYLGKHMKCPRENSSVLVNCLRLQSVEDLIAADPIFFVWHIDPLIPWKPAVEPEHEGAFLTQRPKQLLESGDFIDVPFLTGVTSHEGLFRAAGIINYDPTLVNWNALPIRSYTSALNLYHLPIEELKDAITRLREFYFKSDNVKIEHEEQFVNMFSDRYFFHPMAKALELQRRHQESPIFAYRFGTENPGVTFARYFSFLSEDDTEYKGLCHGDEMIYLYPLEKTFFKEFAHTDEGSAMIDRTLELWINFAIHGNPTPEGYDVAWNPVKSEDIEYLSINGPKDLKMDHKFYNERLALWEELNLEREIPEDADFLLHDEL